jgi:hypothetical protein
MPGAFPPFSLPNQFRRSMQHATSGDPGAPIIQLTPIANPFFPTFLSSLLRIRPKYRELRNIPYFDCGNFPVCLAFQMGAPLKTLPPQRAPWQDFQFPDVR